MIPSLEEWYRDTFSPWGKTDPAGHQPSISMSQGTDPASKNLKIEQPIPNSLESDQN